MIEMFVAMTILFVLIAVTLMAIMAAPWWVGLFFVSILVVAINWLLHPSQDEEGD